MTNDEKSEIQALLVRAAHAEAHRQAARDAHNVDAQRRAEDELRRLWARYTAIERQVA